MFFSYHKEYPRKSPFLNKLWWRLCMHMASVHSGHNTVRKFIKYISEDVYRFLIHLQKLFRRTPHRLYNKRSQRQWGRKETDSSQISSALCWKSLSYFTTDVLHCFLIVMKRSHRRKRLSISSISMSSKSVIMCFWVCTITVVKNYSKPMWEWYRTAWEIDIYFSSRFFVTPQEPEFQKCL